MQIALIVNGKATRVTPERVVGVEHVLRRAGTVVTLETHAPRHGIELARQASASADAIVAFSGDGGFNEVLNGIARDLPVGFVPGGGTSVLPRALGLPRDPIEAATRIAQALSEKRTRRISLGSVNGYRFAFEAGIGVDAEVVRRVDRLGRDEQRPAPRRLRVRALARYRTQRAATLARTRHRGARPWPCGLRDRLQR